MDFTIIDLGQDLVEQTAALLRDTFMGRTEDWQDLESARAEVMESLGEGRISRVAVGASNAVAGWIGGIPSYEGRVWEIHPLVVASGHRRQGIGRALVRDLEKIAARMGALTLWAGSDDEHGETTLGGADLYADLPSSIRDIRNLKQHPYEFYVRLGFRIVGVMPDANGVGKPDIVLAKRITPSRSSQ